MAGFMLSPGVQVSEKDFTSIVPAVSTSVGASVGVFKWGPVMDPIRISSENELVQRFGAPNDGTATSFFSAANFLSYSSNLLVTRVDTTNQLNSVTTKTGRVTSITIPDGQGGSGYTMVPTVTVSLPEVSGGIRATATAVLTGGVVTSIVVNEQGSGYTAATVSITPAVGDTPTTSASAVAAVADASGIKIKNFTDYITKYEGGAGVVGEFAARYPGSIGNSIKVSIADSATFNVPDPDVGPASATNTKWKYAGEFDTAPDVGEIHVIVIDASGAITGTDETVLEKFAYLSKASDGRRSDGSNAYYKFVINNSSQWIYWMDHPTAVQAGGTAWGSTGTNTNGATVTFSLLTVADSHTVTLSGGADDFDVGDDDKMNAFALYQNDEIYDISLIVGGKASTTVANFVISNVAEYRKDCVAYFSPEDAGEIITGTNSELADKMVTYRNALPSSSYAVLDSGYKYQYDRYNDVYRWVPLNADIAGLCARADFTDDPWFSPAGYTRGQIKNVVKLAYNPNRAARDTLYKAGINSVVSFPGQGTVLYGDKTLFAKPSAFDRINVRRLFIVLEKAIATAAKYQLFEFNDQFTRAQFRSMVEPFLRDVQGRRGITDFRVKCDETNNTGQIIETNQFVADIFVKPSRSINFVSLNFIAARQSVSFEEIGG